MTTICCPVALLLSVAANMTQTETILIVIFSSRTSYLLRKYKIPTSMMTYRGTFKQRNPKFVKILGISIVQVEQIFWQNESKLCNELV